LILILVDKQIDLETSKADGLMGLSNYAAYKNIFEKGFE
jgi:hypothetical protein